METPDRSVKLTQVKQWDDGEVRSSGDYLAAEEPLEITVAGKPLVVTMRTPGHDREPAARLHRRRGGPDAGQRAQTRD